MEYVIKMFNLRVLYSKDHPMNYIAKILMNSLYGRLGMKLEQTEMAIYDTTSEVNIDALKDNLEIYNE